MAPKKKVKYNPPDPVTALVLAPILAAVTPFPPRPQTEPKLSPTSVLSGNIPNYPPPLNIYQSLVQGIKPFEIQNHINKILPRVLEKSFTDQKLLKAVLIERLQEVFPEYYPNPLEFYRKLHKDNLSHWFETLVKDNLSK